MTGFIVQVICLAGLLAAVAGGLHRRSRNKLRDEVMRAAGALPPALTGAIALPVIVAVAVRSIMALAVTT